jgi:hypothetical protein
MAPGIVMELISGRVGVYWVKFSKLLTTFAHSTLASMEISLKLLGKVVKRQSLRELKF